MLDEVQNEELQRIIDEINSRLKDRPDAPVLKTSGEIYPTDTVPIIVLRNGVRSAHPAKWGFPKFNKPGVIINAKSETLKETMFRDSFQNRRCIVPASGYLEWRKDPEKQKLFIHTGKPLLYLAGLYGIFRDKNDKPYTGFVIITTEPSSAISPIHNRMPVILTPERAEQWLAENDAGTLQDLLRPYDDVTIENA